MDVHKSFPLIKSNSRTIYGVIMAPEVEDADGDIISEDEIEEAAHQFISEWRNEASGVRIGLNHKEPANGISIVETAIATEDMKLGNIQVKKGSWWVALKVDNDQIWKDIGKGIYKGLSWAGSARREKRYE